MRAGLPEGRTGLPRTNRREIT